ncbi:hypothetical protein AAY473_008895 [Plecturocebus cupreus]
MNLSKTGVTGPSGSFLECLQKVYQIYTPFDPVAPKNSHAINLAFVAQAVLDIRRKAADRARKRQAKIIVAALQVTKKEEPSSQSTGRGYWTPARKARRVGRFPYKGTSVPTVNKLDTRKMNVL